MKLIPKEITEKGKETWSNFLKKTESGHFFQAFDWGVFKETQGWKVHRIMLQGENGEPKAALSILEKRIPLFGFKIWYLPRGSVCDFKDRGLAAQVFDFLIDYGRKNKVMAIKVSPDVVLSEETKWLVELLKEKRFKETDDYQLHKCTIRIDLKDKSAEEIFADFKKNTRWEIGKAEKDGVFVKKGENENDLKVVYQLYTEAMGKNRLPYDYFKNFWEIFKKDILILIASYQGQPISAVLVPFSNKKYWYLFGGSAKKYPTHNSSQLLQWEIIKRAKEHGAEIYDLQGIPCGEPKTPHDKGVLQFKEGFGGERIELIGEFDYAFFPILYQIFCKLNQARIITKGIMGRV